MKKGTMSTGLTLLGVAVVSAQIGGLKAGSKSGYLIKQKEISYDGSSDKVTKTYETTTPFVLEILNSTPQGAKVKVTSGPINVKGKPVGRARINEVQVDKLFTRNGSPLASLMVPALTGNLSVGKSWKGVFSSLPPVPANLDATYKIIRFLKVDSTDLAEVAVTVKGTGTCETNGKGTLLVRKSDGSPYKGTVGLDLKFMRLNDKKQLTVNSKLRIEFTVSPN